MEQTHLARIRANEERFAEANERIREAAETHEVDPAPFLCECSAVRCTAVICLALDTYARVREAGHFLVCPGHDDPHVERVIEDCGSYQVVEKLRSDDA